jgi:hypothetical protein
MYKMDDNMHLRLMANPFKIKGNRDMTIDDIFFSPLKKIMLKYSINHSEYSTILIKIENILQELVIQNIISEIIDKITNECAHKTCHQ